MYLIEKLLSLFEQRRPRTFEREIKLSAELSLNDQAKALYDAGTTPTAAILGSDCFLVDPVKLEKGGQLLYETEYGTLKLSIDHNPTRREFVAVR